MEIKILEVTKNPISVIGYNAGICYNSDIEDKDKNYKRGLRCIEEGHGEMVEFPVISFIIDKCSARVIREICRHRMSTKAQASTRYINYDNFGYYTPPQIEENKQAKVIYDDFMDIVEIYYNKLQELDINKEHIANILPLGMETKIVFQCNLRELIHIFGLRSCSRAYIEARELCKVLKNEIINIDNEWKLIADKFLKPKCKTCTEKNNCEVSNG